MKNTKKYNNVNEYYEALSGPAKKAFLIGIKYALKIIKEAKKSEDAQNELVALLSK